MTAWSKNFLPLLSWMEKKIWRSIRHQRCRSSIFLAEMQLYITLHLFLSLSQVNTHTHALPHTHRGTLTHARIFSQTLTHTHFFQPRYSTKLKPRFLGIIGDLWTRCTSGLVFEAKKMSQSEFYLEEKKETSLWLVRPQWRHSGLLGTLTWTEYR